jgi:hypothetical protein
VKVGVFTSNQPRHVSLVNLLAEHFDVVHAVIETTSVGVGNDDGPIPRYMQRVRSAERRFFGDGLSTRANVSSIALPMGDVNHLERGQLSALLEVDRLVVFGSDYIKGWLVEELVARRTINIHMGLSPYFRGAACNFWALHDGLPGHVGATLHYLARGLDDGPILQHVVPTLEDEGPFEYTMKAVRDAHLALLELLKRGAESLGDGEAQDRSLEVRYSRSRDFTPEIASAFLERGLDNAAMREMIATAPAPRLIG